MRIGLLGGSFDPPHAGHLHISRVALNRLGLDALWWLVTVGNPLKPVASPLGDRISAAKELVRRPKIEVVDLEAQLGSPYTVDVLSHLTRRHPAVSFVWIMGADAFVGLDRWRDWRRIMRMVPIAVLDRPGYRLAARASRAGHAFARFRVDESDAKSLAGRHPPAWTLLTLPLSNLSSSALRKSHSPQ